MTLRSAAPSLPLAGLLLAVAAGCAAPGDPNHPDRLDEALAPAEAAAEGGAPPQESLLARLDGILKENDAHHRSLLLRSRLLLRLCRPREALRDLNRLRDLYPPEPDVAALRGRALYDLGSKREAQAAFRQALDLDPRNTDALVGTGILLAEGGALPEAARYFGRAGEIDPSNAQAKALLAAASAPQPSALQEPLARQMAGRLLSGAGRLKEGTDLLLALLKERPDDPEVLKAAASGLSRQGHDRPAERLLSHAAALNPRDAETAFALGSVTARLAASEPALLPRASRLFEQAAAMAPRDARPLLAAANLHARSGGLSDAARCFKGAAAADPTDPAVPLDHGLFLVRSGDLVGAIAVYRRGLERTPGDALLQGNLMAALYEFGRPKEAGEIRMKLAERSDLEPAAKAVLDAYSGARK